MPSIQSIVVVAREIAAGRGEVSERRWVKWTLIELAEVRSLWLQPLRLVLKTDYHKTVTVRVDRMLIRSFQDQVLNNIN